MGFTIKDGVLEKYTEEPGVTDVVIPDGVTSIKYYAFSNQKHLTSVIIPESVTEIGDAAFMQCSGLTSVRIPKKVTKIGERAFDWCTSLEHLNIPEGVSVIGSGAFGYLFGYIPWFEQQKEEFVIVGDHILIKYNGTDSVVQIPDGVKTLWHGVFKNDKNLTGISIPESVTEIGMEVFKGCTNLSDISIPQGVTCVGYCLFYNCENLQSVILPEHLVHIGHSVFAGCKSLTSITIPEHVETIGWSAFKECSALTSISIPRNVKKIEDRTFENCTSLAHIDFPEHISEFGLDAFSNTPWLKDQKDEFVIIGNHFLYRYQGNRTEIEIPPDVIYMGKNAIEDCEGLKKAVYRGIVMEQNADKRVGVGDMLAMVFRKEFSIRMSQSVKYDILWQMYLHLPEDDELFVYIKKNFTKMFQFAITDGNVDAVEKVIQSGKFLTAKNIDKFILHAAEQEQDEIELILSDHKDELPVKGKKRGV